MHIGIFFSSFIDHILQKINNRTINFERTAIIARGKIGTKHLIGTEKQLKAGASIQAGFHIFKHNIRVL